MKLRQTKVAIATSLSALTLGTLVSPAAVSAATSGASSASAPAVLAEAGSRLERFRSACNHEIDRRLFVLAIADNWVNNARRLSDEERATMLASNASVRDHLENVNRPAVNAATNREELAAACDAIFTDNRVYLVVIPQLLITIRSTQIADGLEALSGLADRKASEGHDTTEGAGWLAEATTHIDAAVAASTSVTVESFNADPAAGRAAFDTAVAENDAAWDLAVQSFFALIAM